VGTNLPNAVCCCYNPSRIYDGSTTYVWIRTPQWHLKLKFPLSLNRNELNDCVYLNFSPNQWIQIYRVFREHLQKKRLLLTGWFCVNIMSKRIRLSVFVEQFLKFGEIESKVLTEPESLIFYLNKALPVLFCQLYNWQYFCYSFLIISEQILLLWMWAA